MIITFFFLNSSYPTYSSYRSFWNTLIRRKEAATAAEEVKPTAESEKPVDLAHEELLKSIEEFKQESDELKVCFILLLSPWDELFSLFK